ncbi:TetR/AcrR family transcriptional regulator [Mycobacterium sp. 852014-52144_SCH5372336]|uniref:TetR/AcrR family transcriptional regulator n=1 Tax=Mycobacterium sp. 852014-52144_SCH5372336 TaxID=1834115 RepID=UPI0018D38398|nr:TetR/AcrR family transcriptional regulator [Mycobacterium sp. 852014-52144_SCH5372336]
MHQLLANGQQGEGILINRSGSRYQRLSPDQRRQSILAGAAELFSARPYSEVSTADIARHVGVARGLLNHYFGTKRELYLEVVREAATVPPAAVQSLPDSDLNARIEAAVAWFLTSLEQTGRSWLTAAGGHTVGRDEGLDRILAKAEDDSVDRVIEAVGLSQEDQIERLRALIRPFGQLARAAGREWLLKDTLTRAQAYSLLVATLTTIVCEVYPAQVQDNQ